MTNLPGHKFKTCYNVSVVKFCKHLPNIFAIGTWEGYIEVYKFGNEEIKLIQSTKIENCSVLDIDWIHGNDSMVVGCSDGTVVYYHMKKRQQKVLCSHSRAVSALKCIVSEGKHYVVSASWDGTLYLSSLSSRSRAPVQTISNLNKIFKLDANSKYIIVATAMRKIHFYRIKAGKISERFAKTSQLKSQIRNVKLFPSLAGYISSSVEGRVEVQVFDPRKTISYAFKCHRTKDTKTESVYPVHQLSFTNDGNVFATGGGDGSIFIWDPWQQKSCGQFPKSSNSIIGLDISQAGNLISASTYGWENGIDGKAIATKGTEIVIYRIDK